MREIKINELSMDAFKKYGSYSNMIEPDAPRLEVGSIRFFRDMEILDLGCSTNASFSVTQVKKRPFVIDMAEFHMDCGEALIPLDGDVLIHVGIATPNEDIPLDQIEVFYVPKGTLVVLRPGVWHCAPFPYETQSTNILIVLPERTYAKDCSLNMIAEEDRIKIKDTSIVEGNCYVE